MFDLESPDNFQPASFPVTIRLGNAEPSLQRDAAEAVKQEFQDCSKWKCLTCIKVSVFSERERGTVFILDIEGSLDFNWTLEGATAFRPRSLDEKKIFHIADYENMANDEELLWSAEVLEVDEVNKHLYIALDDEDSPPTTGAFFVRPFEFLAVLNSAYNDATYNEIQPLLPSRLDATQGGIHPKLDTSSKSLPQLQSWWKHSWCVLWGPPGTGKTFTTGRQIGNVLSDESERILVISTTNRATDAVALSIGRAVKERQPNLLEDGQIVRVGKGASFPTYRESGLESMLIGTESDMLSQMDSLNQQLRLFDNAQDKALTRSQLGKVRQNTLDRSRRLFVDPHAKVVVATVFKAMNLLRDPMVKKMIENHEAPFTTIFIDEAGLISRASVAVLSLLASRKVVLVGDSKQLAPISQISRILPTRQQVWLASSGLSHLEKINETPDAVHVLSEQRRMNPDVCQVVSKYQYNGFLKTAPERASQLSNLASSLASFSRTIWYVLDEEDASLVDIRAARGPNHKSWIRPITPKILQKIFADSEVSSSRGLFISPFAAQAEVVSKFLSKKGLESWESSTVHSQQGSEADIVIFDTVNASNCSWPVEEWKRLINVGLSRSREAFILLASRSEMEEPYLKPLIKKLKHGILVEDQNEFVWQAVSTEEKQIKRRRKPSPPESSPKTMGEQIAHRKETQPILSAEQQRLVNLTLDGKPRLVRGVAGSGKSIVMCNWLAKTAKRLKHDYSAKIWAVYANRSLHKLLERMIESAWKDLSEGGMFGPDPFPWEKVRLLHVKDVLDGLLPSVSLTMSQFKHNYDSASQAYLERLKDPPIPRCSALFIDEAQDCGPSTLRLLLSLVEQNDPEDPNSRSAHIFYDNAQNIYGRKTPKWSEFGLDMRGRSTIMRESFRSTRQITELALNVFYQNTSDEQRQDLQELISMGLVELEQQNDHERLSVKFTQQEGPKPRIRTFESRSEEFDAIGRHLSHLITTEGIKPRDICIIYNGQEARELIESILAERMNRIGVEISVQTTRSFHRKDNTLLTTTSHSYKGYESEVVIIPCIDGFSTSGGKLLASNLYVAMTRARSLLAIYGRESKWLKSLTRFY